MQLQPAQENDYSSISTPVIYLHDMTIKDNHITHKSILYSYFDKYINLFWKCNAQTDYTVHISILLILQNLQ